MVLPDIINNDQTGFLKGISISENVRLLNSVIIKLRRTVERSRYVTIY